MRFELGRQQARQIGPGGALIESQVADPVARLGEGGGEGAHGGKEGEHLLAMVAAVVGLLAQLHHQVADSGILRVKPAVTCVQLIPENEAQLHQGCPFRRRQRSLQ